MTYHTCPHRTGTPPAWPQRGEEELSPQDSHAHLPLQGQQAGLPGRSPARRGQSRRRPYTASRAPPPRPVFLGKSSTGHPGSGERHLPKPGQPPAAASNSGTVMETRPTAGGLQEAAQSSGPQRRPPMHSTARVPEPQETSHHLYFHIFQELLWPHATHKSLTGNSRSI